MYEYAIHGVRVRVCVCVCLHVDKQKQTIHLCVTCIVYSHAMQISFLAIPQLQMTITVALKRCKGIEMNA